MHDGKGLEEVFVFKEQGEYIALIVCYSDGCRAIMERPATEEEIKKFLKESDGARSINIRRDD